MKNIVIEIIRDEDYTIGVKKCGAGEWSWLDFIMSGSEFGGVESISVDSWGEIEEELKKLFDEYKKEESEVGLSDEKWDGLWIEFVNGIKGEIDKGRLSFMRIGGYSIEYDNCMVVIFGVEEV